MTMYSKFIRLFCLNERSHLEKNLNEILFKDKNAVIRIWTTKQGNWCASVIYQMEQPSYPKQEIEYEA